MTIRQLVTLRRLAAAALLLAVTVLAAVATEAFRSRGAAAPSPPTSRPLHVATVTLRSAEAFWQPRTFTGLVKAARTSELGFERAGRLTAVLVDQGQRVTEGQPLARLDTRNLEARRDQLAAERQAAEARLEELESGPREETIEGAAAEVRSLEAELELAVLNVGRRRQLVSQGAVSREEFDRTELGRRVTAGQLDAARQRLAELKNGTRPEQLAAQRAAVGQLDAQLRSLEVDLQNSEIVAPFAGVIAERLADEGTIIAPAAPLLRLVEDQSLEAWVGLPLEIATSLTLDVDYEFTAAGGAARGRLEALLPELDRATRTRMAVFRLANTPDLAPGLAPAQVVRLVVQQRSPAAEGAFWLPDSALARGRRGLWAVFVATPQTAAGGEWIAARRDIELLQTQSDRVLVRGALRVGDRVVRDGVHRLSQGQRIVAGDAPSAELQEKP